MDHPPVARQPNLRTLLVRNQATVYCALAFWLAGCNPFAPGIDNVFIDRNALLGDRASVSGFFSYFRNTYELRDTLLYGKMIAPDFKFVYFDFANNNQTFWDRDIEMQSAFRLFRSIKSVTLLWNNYVRADTASSDTLALVERYFNLTIVQDDQNIFRGTGSAELLLVRGKRGEPWRMRQWRDKSDF